MQYDDIITNPRWRTDGRHIENRFLAISRRHIGRLMRNLYRKWRITCRYRSRDQNCNFHKIKMADGRPSENSYHSVARQCAHYCKGDATLKYRLVGLGYSTWVRWVVSTNIMHFNEFEYRFACSRKAVHLCFIMSPGKMIFAVLELLLNVTLTVSLNW